MGLSFVPIRPVRISGRGVSASTTQLGDWPCRSLLPPQQDRVCLDAATVLPSWGNGAPELLIQLPSNYGVRPSKGPDSDVFYLGPKGEPSSDIMLYVGHNPSAPAPSESAQEIRGTIRGRTITWRRWVEGAAGARIFKQEAMIRALFDTSASGYGGLIVHALIMGPDAGTLERRQRIVETLRPGN